MGVAGVGDLKLCSRCFDEIDVVLGLSCFDVLDIDDSPQSYFPGGGVGGFGIVGTGPKKPSFNGCSGCCFSSSGIENPSFF